MSMLAICYGEYGPIYVPENGPLQSQTQIQVAILHRRRDRPCCLLPSGDPPSDTYLAGGICCPGITLKASKRFEDSSLHRLILPAYFPLLAEVPLGQFPRGSAPRPGACPFLLASGEIWGGVGAPFAQQVSGVS